MASNLPVKTSAPQWDAAYALEGLEGLHRSHRRYRWTLWVCCVGLVTMIAWAHFSRIDQVTRAQGQVIASARTQNIQAIDPGVVRGIHVREGEQVQEGQQLVTLEKEKAEAAVNDSRSKVAALRITLARLQAEVYGRALVIDKDLQSYTDYIHNQRALFERRKRAIEEDVASLRATLSLVNQELKLLQQLEKTGDVSRVEILRLQRTASELNAQIINKRNKYLQDSQAEMTKAQEDLSTQIEVMNERAQTLEQTQLFAPRAGIVKLVNVTTLGAVVRPGDVLMEIVPTGGDLVVEVKVSPADIAFLEVGQIASVKLDAYDYSIFGAMKGEVSYISPDTLDQTTQGTTEHYYRVQIRIKESEFQDATLSSKVKIRPGMTVSVDIKALERSVLSYLLKPITKTLSQALTER